MIYSRGLIMDARVRHSQLMLKTSLLSLLKDRNLTDITVTDICKCADVNRATFYKYYNSPEDLLGKIEDEHFNNLRDKIIRENPEDITALCGIISRDVKENFEFYFMIFTKEGNPDFRKKMIGTLHDANINMLDSAFPNLSPAHREMLYYFITSGCMGIFTVWIEKGMQEPVESLDEFVTTYLGQTYAHGKDFKDTL